MSFLSNPPAPTQRVVPTTGNTIVITQTRAPLSLILAPAGTLATLTVTLPGGAYDGQPCVITSTAAVTALTVNAASGSIVGDALTSFAANDSSRYVWNSGVSAWYRTASSLGGYSTAESQSVLDNALPMANYTALRAYTGRALAVRITSIGVAGIFWRDASDSTSADNGGTIIVDASSRRWKRIFSGSVDAFWFGAVGDNVADDTAALNACGTWAAAQKLTVVISPTSAGYKTTDTVTLPVGANLDMTGAHIKYAGTKDRPALVLGTLTVANMRPVYKGISVEQTGSLSWPSMSHVGVRCINAIRGNIDVRYVYGFTTNWECYSDNQGYAYNTHQIQELNNGKYAMVLRTVGAAGNGNFVNENTFIGGRYGCDSSANALGSRYGVLLTWDKVSSYRGQNANRWLYPCFELQNPSSGESIAMHFDGAGGFNRVLEARRESGIGPFARLDGDNQAFMTVANNIFSVLYGASANAGFVRGLEEINGANSNTLEGDQALRRDPISWSSGRIVDLISGYGTNRPYIRGPLFLITNTTTTPSKWLDMSLFKTFKDDVYLANGVGVGVVLDTTKVKRFNVSLAARTSRGRIDIKCFDAAGAVLVPGTLPYPYAMTPGNQMAVVTKFGGSCYEFQSDTATGDYSTITFTSDVKKAWVIFNGGTNPLLLESFAIQGFPEIQTAAGDFVYASMTILSSVPGSEDQMFARAKPDTEAQHGVYKRGQTVFNGVAATGLPSHWTAITNDVGYLNKPWVASTAYAYTGEIVINGTNAYVCTTAGTSAGSGGPTGTGTAITDNTVVWDYLGPKAVFATGQELLPDTSVSTVTTTSTLDAASAKTVLANATSGAIVLTLPTAASSNGLTFNIKKIDSSANTVTLDGSGAETIDGATTFVLNTQWQSAQIQSNGTAWYLL